MWTVEREARRVESASGDQHRAVATVPPELQQSDSCRTLAGDCKRPDGVDNLSQGARPVLRTNHDVCAPDNSRQAASDAPPLGEAG